MFVSGIFGAHSYILLWARDKGHFIGNKVKILFLMAFGSQDFFVE